MSRRNAEVHRRDPPAEVLSYYSAKTSRILAKYGPGPRVHFHTGLRAREVAPGASRDEVREAMVESQERLLDRVAVTGERILDVGCGLGGAAIRFATHLGADVTAITIVPEHVDVVRRFSREAGAHTVTALLRDAHDLAALGPFDAAVAIESSCYFDRRRWFQELRAVLPVGGRVHVVDCFEGDPSIAGRFDAYWRTRIGTLQTYDDAADLAGFERVATEDWGPDTRAFWALSRRWTALSLEVAPQWERSRLERSSGEHAWLSGAIEDERVRYLYVAFRRAR